MGGSNDISRNNIKGALKNVNEFVKGKETNIVLIKAPHRHDLIPRVVREQTGGEI